MYTITFKDLFINYIKKHPVTFGLIVANTLMFFVFLFAGGFTTVNLIHFGGLVPNLVTQGDYWRIITAMFIHASFIHFFFNTFFLYYIGGFMEKLFGSLKYGMLYFISGIGSSIFVWLFADPGSVTVGASGALYGIMAGLFLLTFIKPTWFHPQSIRSIRLMVAINAFFTFASVLNDGNISAWGHLGGFIVGAIVTYFITPDRPYRTRRIYQQKRTRQDTHHGRTVIDAEIDDDDTYDSYYKN